MQKSSEENHEVEPEALTPIGYRFFRGSSRSTLGGFPSLSSTPNHLILPGDGRPHHIYQGCPSSLRVIGIMPQKPHWAAGSSQPSKRCLTNSMSSSRQSSVQSHSANHPDVQSSTRRSRMQWVHKAREGGTRRPGQLESPLPREGPRRSRAHRRLPRFSCSSSGFVSKHLAYCCDIAVDSARASVCASWICSRSRTDA